MHHLNSKPCYRNNLLGRFGLRCSASTLLVLPTGVSSKLLPELQIVLKELGVVDKADFVTIQKEIDKLNNQYFQIEYSRSFSNIFLITNITLLFIIIINYLYFLL